MKAKPIPRSRDYLLGRLSNVLASRRWVGGDRKMSTVRMINNFSLEKKLQPSRWFQDLWSGNDGNQNLIKTFTYKHCSRHAVRCGIMNAIIHGNKRTSPSFIHNLKLLWNLAMILLLIVLAGFHYKMYI